MYHINANNIRLPSDIKGDDPVKLGGDELTYTMGLGLGL